MKYALLALFILIIDEHPAPVQQRIFDVHLHGNPDPSAQLPALEKAGVYKIAVSTSWNLQQLYKDKTSLSVLHGLMVPCPDGKVPYSGQACFDDNSEWPSTTWVEDEIKKGTINFIGEVLSQYHGISSSDDRLLPYYLLADKYQLPVGIHTGSAGPDHGCANFTEQMGNPKLMENMLDQFPKLKVWIMHSGLPYLDEAIAIMKKYQNVYTDISAINNPQILPSSQFSDVMKKLIDNGLEDRIMFGSDNGKIDVMINSVNALSFLTDEQKEKIFYKNAERFFKTP